MPKSEKDAPCHHPLDSNVWRDAIMGGDAQRLADLAFDEFEFEVTDHKRLISLCRSVLGHMGSYWSEATWRMAVKYIITHHCRVEMPPEPNEELGLRLTVDLHIGFVSILETEEQLAVLDDKASPIGGWTYPVSFWSSDGSELTPESPSLARSKVFRTNNPIVPINRVAARVAPPPDRR